MKGFRQTRVLAAILGHHCTESQDQALTFGAPIGFGLAAAILAHARQGRGQQTAAIGLIVVAGSTFACSIAVANLFGAIDRGKQKYTMADMRRIATGIEDGHAVEGRVDGCGTPYLIQRSGSSYTIVSFGDCGVPDVPLGTKYPSGTTASFKDDIVFADGHFIRYPLGTMQ